MIGILPIHHSSKDKSLKWLQRLGELTATGRTKSDRDDIEKLYNDAYNIFYSKDMKPDKPLDEIITKVNQKCGLSDHFKGKLIFKNQIIFEKIESMPHAKNVRVPLCDSDKSLAKEILPFIPSFQMDLQDESEREHLDSRISYGDTIVLIAASGSGKTALISRRLAVNPGILFTCCRDFITNFRGTDYCSYALHKHIQGLNTLELFATVRQLVQCDFISRLVYLDMCYKYFNELKTDERGPFKNVNQFLAFSQYNGNTEISAQIFSDLRKELVRYNILDLRILTIKLVNHIRTKLNSHNSPFLFAFDEANVFSNNLKSELLSNNGSKRDILSIIHSEVMALRKINSSKMCDIYLGTLFTSDIIDVIHSSSHHGKIDDITNKICNFCGLDSLSIGNAKQMIEMIYHTNMLQNLFDEQIIFPTRRRVLGMLCETLKNRNKQENLECGKVLSNFPFKSSVISPLKMCWINFVQSIVQTTKKRIEEHTFPLDMLKEIYIRGSYPQFFSEHIHVKATLAAHLVGTGLATPTGIYGHYYFKCTDPITKQVCKELMSHYFPQMECNNISMSIVKLMLTPGDVKDKSWEKIFAYLLGNYNQKSTKEIPFLKSFKPITQLKVTRYMDALDFYYYYYNTDWAETATKQLLGQADITTLPTEKFIELGDYLYCVSKVDSTADEKECNQFREIVDGLVYFPSVYCHPDSILINIKENSNKHVLYLTSNKIHNCDRDTYVSSACRDGEKSVNHELFYTDNYKKNSSLHKPSSKWWSDFKTNSFLLCQ